MLKEGAAEDHANRERSPSCCASPPPTSEGADAGPVPRRLHRAHAARARKRIYYVTADSLAAARGSPHLEVFAQKGIEVLLLSDRVDEWMGSYLASYAGKPLQHVGKGEIDLDELGPAPDAGEREKAEQTPGR